MLAFTLPAPLSTQFPNVKHISSTVGERSFQKLRQSRPVIVSTLDGVKYGKITLVGVGPGDAKYLTSAAETALKNADAILYDRLADDTILSNVKKSGMIFESVGKSRKKSDEGRKFNTRQDDINERIVTLAKKGLHVVRVKGGDTAIFSRLSDELKAARDANIPVEVVPGITTASVVASQLQFPLTGGKGIANGVCFISAHEGAHWLTSSLMLHVTLAIYMGLQELESLLNRLTQGDQGIDSKVCKNIAAVAVQAVSTPQQKVVFGTAATIAEGIKREELKSPTVVIVGEAVRLAKDWPNNSEEIALNQ